MNSHLLALAWSQLWQVTVLVVIVAALVRTVARNRPHLAYVLWLVVLVKCVTPPLFTSTSGVFCWLQPVEQAAMRTAATPLDSTLVAGPSHEPAELIIPLYPVDAMPSGPAEPVAIVEPMPVRFSPLHVAAIGLTVWLLGAAVSLGSAVWQWRACLRAARRMRVHGNDDLKRYVQDLAQRLGLRRPVRIIVTEGRLGPAVTGIVRPALLMPEGMLTGKTPVELEPILVHELLHIRRGDLWAGLLQTTVLALWWFHPLVRWAVRESMREAERCCDEAVLAELGCKPKDYARSLLGVLQYKMEWAPAPAFPGAGRIDATAKRLERIMGLGQGCRRRSPWWCWMVMVGVAAVVLPGGAFVVSGEEETSVASDGSASPLQMARGPQLTIETTWISADSASMESIVASEMSPEEQTQIKKAGHATLTEIQSFFLMKQIGELTSARILQSPKMTCRSGQQVFVSSDDAAMSITPRVQADNTIRIKLNLKKTGNAEENGAITRSAETIAPDGSTILLAAPRNETDAEENDVWVMVCLRQVVPARGKSVAASIAEEPAAGPDDEEADRYWVTYEAADVLEEIEQTADNREEAKTELMGLCGLEADRQGPHAPESRIVWKDDTLIAVATEAEHNTIRAELEAIREHGLCSLEIEVLCVQGPTAEIEAMVESEGAVAELLKEEERRAATEGRLTCKSLVVRSDLEQVMRQSKANPAVRVLASPRLRVESGQTATVRIGEEIPVGPAAAKESAARRYVPVGLEMQFQPRLRAGNAVLLHSDVTLSEAEREEWRTHSQSKWRMSGIRVFSQKASSTTLGALGDTIAIRTQSPAAGNGDSEQALLFVRVMKSEASPPPIKAEPGSFRAWLPLGLEFETIDEEAFRREFSTRYRGGLRVTKVRPDSPAAEQGIRVGDILVGLHTWETKSLKDLADVLDRSDLEEVAPLKFYILRDVDVLNGHLPIAREPATSEIPKGQAEIYVRTYVVSDLVLPLPNSGTISLGLEARSKPSPAQRESLLPYLVRQDLSAPDFDSLVTLLTSAVSPATWEEVGGRGSIACHEANLSLIVRQTAAVHEEIVDVLKQLRNMSNVQVVLRARTIEASDEFCSQHLAQVSEQTPSVVVDRVSMKRLLDHADGQVKVSRPLSLFNGQQVQFALAHLDKGTTATDMLQLQPVISEDRRSVSLTAHTVLTTHHHARLELASGDSAALEVTSLVKASEPSRRTFVLITAEVVIAEEAGIGAS
jgi:beta-lactamase regulating signal transducer with metallopeptidase domain/ABC-type amino acid transport substrate-binding protein